MAFTTSMQRQHQPRSGAFLGGIGTGGIELRHNGEFHSWSIFNNQPLGLGPRLPRTFYPNSMLFFLVRFQEEGGEPMIRLLQIEDMYGAAGIMDHPHYYVFPWLRGIDRIDYEASFPFTTLRCSDKDMPLEITLEAWSPFIPHDVKNSSLPCANVTITARATGDKPVDVMILGTMRNAVGYDVPERVYASQLHRGADYVGFTHNAGQLPADHQSDGSMGLAVTGGQVSHYLGWEHRHPYYEIVLRNDRLPDIDDTDGRNSTDAETGARRAMERCYSTVASSQRLAPGEQHAARFAAAWHFPNRLGEAADSSKQSRRADPDRREGHYYSNFFGHASEVLDYLMRKGDRLEEKTRAFHGHFFDSTAPRFVLDQINSHLSTFISSAWLTEAGHFGVLEGLDPELAFAGLFTTDVAMYGGIMAACLFPELDKAGLRHHRAMQAKDGQVQHAFSRNFSVAVADTLGERTRLDMPAQYAFQVLRAAFFTGDDAFLAEMWPSVRAAIDYGLRERDKDGDGLPDMEGVMCSYDNFPMYGVASYVAGQWLAAYKAAALAAEHLGDDDAAERYQALVERGSKAFEAAVWNGSYYRLCSGTADDPQRPDDGCLSDQTIGQWAAHQLGVDDLLAPDRVRAALGHVMQTNFHPMYGVRNCSWPGDGFLHEIGPDTWVDQANTAWSGVELGLAALLFYQGLEDEALTVIKAVDDRYREMGLYFDHQEFGGHYFRPMSAWGIVNAMLGLSVRGDHYRFAPKLSGKKQRLFFSHGHGTATYRQGSDKIEIVNHDGHLTIASLSIAIPDKAKKLIVRQGKTTLDDAAYSFKAKKGQLRLVFSEPLTLHGGESLRVVMK